MPKYTKEELQAIVDGLGEEDSVKLLSEEEVNQIASGIRAKEAQKAKDARSEADTLKTEMETLKTQIEEIKSQANGQTQSVQDQLKAEIVKRDQAIEAWAAKHQDAERIAAEIDSRYKNEFKMRTLQAILAAKGVAKSGIEDAALVAHHKLGERLQVKEDNGSLNLVGFNPNLQTETSADEILDEFVKGREYLQAASPSGSDFAGTGPQKDKKPEEPDLTSMPPNIAMKYAMLKDMEKKRKV